MAACKAPAASPPVAELVSKAGALDLAGKQDDAITMFRQALKQDPESYAAHYGIGRALDLAGQYDDARTHLAKAVAIADEGNREQAMRMLAIAWTFGGNIDEAARLFQQVFDRRITAKNFGAATDVANELARVYLEHGDLDRAEEWYRTAHEVALREADLPEWRVDLAAMRLAHAEARIAARRGKAADARKQQTTVKTLVDKSGDADQKMQYPYLAGYVAFYLGNTREAITELEKADQKDPFILLLLAQSHEKLGDAARAQDYYGRVMGSTSHAVNNAFARPIARAKIAR